MHIAACYLLWKKVDVTKQLNSAKHIKCYYHWITNIISIHTIQRVMTQDLLTIFAMNQRKWITPALKIPVDLYIKVSKLQKSIKNEINYIWWYLLLFTSHNLCLTKYCKEMSVIDHSSEYKPPVVQQLVEVFFLPMPLLTVVWVSSKERWLNNKTKQTIRDW